MGEKTTEQTENAEAAAPVTETTVTESPAGEPTPEPAVAETPVQSESASATTYPVEPDEPVQPKKRDNLTKAELVRLLDVAEDHITALDAELEEVRTKPVEMRPIGNLASLGLPAHLTGPPNGEIPGLVNGRVVYYTPYEGEGFSGLTEDEPITGVIVRVWDKVSGCVNMRLLCDGETQNPQGLREWVTSRLFDADGKPGTWRFTR